VKKNEVHSQRAQTQSRAAREPMPLGERLGYTIAEFAALFGRSNTWGYRQLYNGRVKPIADCGRILVPRSEVDAFLARRAEYNPKQKRTRKSKHEKKANPPPINEACSDDSASMAGFYSEDDRSTDEKEQDEEMGAS